MHIYFLNGSVGIELVSHSVIIYIPMADTVARKDAPRLPPNTLQLRI